MYVSGEWRLFLQHCQPYTGHPPVSTLCTGFRPTSLYMWHSRAPGCTVHLAGSKRNAWRLRRSKEVTRKLARQVTASPAGMVASLCTAGALTAATAAPPTASL